MQTKHIAEKKKVVLEDLSKVEPAVNDARNGIIVFCVFFFCFFVFFLVYYYYFFFVVVVVFCLCYCVSVLSPQCC